MSGEITERRQFAIDFGDRLAKVRMERGLSQRELSKQVGVAVNSVWKFEAGMCSPSAFVLAKLCAELSVSADHLLAVEIVPDMDPGLDAFLESCSRECSCCGQCSEHPCGGTQQGAGCDRFRCTCEDDEFGCDAHGWGDDDCG